MKQLNPDRLRQNLNTVVNDVEQILHSLSDTTGEQVDQLKFRAGHRLNHARDRVGELERQAAAQLRQATRQAQGYAREHPWQLLGGLAAITVALTVLSKTRH